MRKILPAVLIVGIALFIGLVVNKPVNVPAKKTAAPSTSNPIPFPASGDNLIKGRAYEIKWIPGSGMIDIFLINRSLESEGVSASIADRIYNIPNSGQYSYRVPTNIADGEYKLQIGEITSKYFNVSWK